MENKGDFYATGKENHIRVKIRSPGDIQTSRRVTPATSYQPPFSKFNPSLCYLANNNVFLRRTTSSKRGGNAVRPQNRNSGNNIHFDGKSRNQNQLPSPTQSRPISILNNSVSHSLPISLQRQQSSKMQQLPRDQGHLALRKGDLLTQHVSARPLPQATPSSISRPSSKHGYDIRISIPTPVTETAKSASAPTPPAFSSRPKIAGVNGGDNEKSTSVKGAAAAQEHGDSGTPTLVRFPYYCHSCCAVVLTPIAFEHHLRSHQVNVIVAYGCSTCKARFSTQSGRDQHLLVVHGDGKGQGQGNGTSIQSDDGDEIQIVAEIPRPRPHPPTSCLIYNGVEEDEEKDANHQISNQNAETAVDFNLDSAVDTELEELKPHSPLVESLELEEPSLCYLCGNSFKSLQSLNSHIFEEHVEDYRSETGMNNNNNNGRSQTEIENDTSSTVTFFNGQGVVKVEPEPETTEKIISTENERRKEVAVAVRRSGFVQDSIEIKTTSLKGPGRRKKYRCRHCGIGFPTFTAAGLHVTSVHKFRNAKQKAKGKANNLKKRTSI